MINKIKINICLISITFFLVVIIPSAVAQSPKVFVSNKNILIGEQIRITIVKQKSPNDSTLNFIIPDSIPHFDIISKNTKDTVIESLLMLKTEIDFTSFDSGSFYFPALEYKKSSSYLSAKTDSFLVNVGYMPIEKDAKPRDIKTIIEVDYTNWFLIKMVTIAILLLLLLLFIVVLVIKNANKKVNKITINKNSYQEAMKAIEKNRVLNEENKIGITALHTSLASILKVYYSEVDKSNILAKTTTEVLDKLDTYKVKAAIAKQAKEALQTGDTTKFANYIPLKIENEEAINFIQNTIQEIEDLRTIKT